MTSEEAKQALMGELRSTIMAQAKKPQDFLPYSDVDSILTRPNIKTRIEAMRRLIPGNESASRPNSGSTWNNR